MKSYDGWKLRDQGWKHEKMRWHIHPLCNFEKFLSFAISLDALHHGIVAKILGERIIPVGHIWSTQPDNTQA